MKTKIIYKDDAILICRKPAGFPVQTKDGFRPDMVSELKNELSRRSGRRDPYLGVVHRLDQPVEGLLVFARTGRAAAELSRQLAEGRMRKKYLAVLTNVPREERGVCIDYLKKEGKSSRAVIASEGDKDARRAELSYEILSVYEEKEPKDRFTESTGEGAALAEIEIKTGRYHQIRVQMAHRGCPLAGDRKYGQNKLPEERASSAGIREAGIRDDTGKREERSLALCAYYLELEHPDTKKRQCFVTVPEGVFFQRFKRIVRKRAEAAKAGRT